MNPTREEALLTAALARPAGERAAFLDGACLGDDGLRARVEALLAAQEPAGETSTEAAPAAKATIKLDLADEPVDEAVGQTLGRYKLLEKVGEGGCGVVYVAEQTEPVRRRVALKVIKLGMDTKQVVARFEAERQALAMMDHPNIAKVLDAGTTGDPDSSAGCQPAVSPTASRLGVASSSASDSPNASQAGSPATRQTGSRRYGSNLRAGRPYFVMELVRGIRITDYCDQANLSTRERLELFIKVCQAIQHAHQKGIIHRDIKPSNILVTLHDGVPVPKVIDFGIAKATEGRLTDNTVYTQLNQFIGTPAYMSPEQAEMSGLDIDTRSDIYSLGVLLYELLTGKTPFDPQELVSQGLDAMRKTIREQEPARPSLRLAALPGEELATTAKGRAVDSVRLTNLLKGDLDWIVMKCLEKDRTRRYETANGLAADLRRHLENEPVTARPPSAAYRLQKAWRRHRLAFAATAAVLGAALAGILGVVVIQRAANAKLTLTNTDLDAARRALSERLAASRRSQTELTFRKGRELAERGEAMAGILWLLESLQIVPAEMADYERLIRLNLGSWSQLLPRLERWWPGQSRVSAVAFSPDGHTVLLGFRDGTLRHLNLATGRELQPPRVFPDRMVAALDFHPHGRSFAIGLAGDGDRSTKDGSSGSAFDTPSDALLWDVATWTQVGEPMPHGGGVHNVRFTRAGTRLVTRQYPGTTLRLWDTATGRPAGEPRVVDQHLIGENLELSPDGSFLLLQMQQPQHSRLLETAGFAPAGAAGLHSLHRFLPDGSAVLVAGPGRGAGAELSLRDWPTGTRRDFALELPTGLLSARFSPGGRELYLVGTDTIARGWDRFTGRLLGPAVPETEQLWAEPDREARFLLTARGQWRLPRLATRPATVLDRIQPGGPAIRFGRAARTAVAYGPGALRVLTQPDGPQAGPAAARLWDAETGLPVGLPLRSVGNTFSDVALSPDGSLAATCALADPGLWEFNTGLVELWDARTGRRRFPPLSPAGAIAVLEFSPDGRLLAGGGYDGKVRFWDTQTGAEAGEPLSLPEIVFSLCFSPDGTKLAAGTTRARKDFPHAQIWDVATRRPVTAPLTGFEREWVLFLEFTPDSRRLLVGSEGRASMWDAATGQPRWIQPRAADRLLAQGLSADGRTLATGDQAGVIRLMDVETGLPTGRPMQHTRPIQCLAFSPDGRWLATGCTEGTVRLWDLATYEPAGLPWSHRRAVFAVRFTDDSRAVVSADAGGRVRVWQLPEPAVGPATDLARLLEFRSLHRLDQGVVRALTRGEITALTTNAAFGAEARLDTPLPDHAWHRARVADAEDDRDWFGAAWHLERLLREERGDWPLRARLVRAHVCRGDFARATQELAEARRLAESVGEADYLSAWLQQAAFEAREARDWTAVLWLLDQTPAATPEDWPLAADRAEALEKLGRGPEAAGEFARALRLNEAGRNFPELAARHGAAGQWRELAEEYARLEKAGWLFLEDWRRYALSLRKAGDFEGSRAVVARFRAKVGTASLGAALPEAADAAGWSRIETSLLSGRPAGAAR